MLFTIITWTFVHYIHFSAKYIRAGGRRIGFYNFFIIIIIFLTLSVYIYLYIKTKKTKKLYSFTSPYKNRKTLTTDLPVIQIKM